MNLEKRVSLWSSLAWGLTFCIIEISAKFARQQRTKPRPRGALREFTRRCSLCSIYLQSYRKKKTIYKILRCEIGDQRNMTWGSEELNSKLPSIQIIPVTRSIDQSMQKLPRYQGKLNPSLAPKVHQRCASNNEQKKKTHTQYRELQ